MNNEAKILSTMEKILQRLDAMEQGVAKLEQGQVGIKAELAEFKRETNARFDGVDEQLAELRTRVNVINDIQNTDYQLLQKLDKKLDNVQSTVDLHDQKFKQIKQAV